MNNKYIILDDCFPVLFTGAQEHGNVKAGRKVTSAGFWKVINGKVSTYGNSLSLKMSPGEFDAEIIQKMIFGG